MTDAAAPALAVEDLHVSYGPIKALKGCSLRVMPGEAVAVVGANGAGKTTLLRAICNMLPSQGTVRLDGEPVRKLPTHALVRRGVLHLPETRGVLAGQTVLENLRLGHDMQPAATRPERSFEAAVEEVFRIFPRLGERRHQKAGSMSGGEQQMLALSRAVVTPPRLLLIDEPSLGLSPLMVREAYRVLRGFRDRGMSILLVEQNVRAALRFAHRGYVLRQGSIVREGEAAALGADAELFSQYLGVA
ncbi:ABC transporter ATP-binding protein [Roseomonas sp. BN140053]|uniref:ABC transporter ATP-binding protein n=1 Tax=Roseomonas sp. BN140053 TaxID=3391898 RepID=UPI0039EB0D94